LALVYDLCDKIQKAWTSTDISKSAPEHYITATLAPKAELKSSNQKLAELEYNFEKRKEVFILEFMIRFFNNYL
jgi:hypothetical protein